MQTQETDYSNLETELARFDGTNNYYKHWLGLIYTDGVKFLAEKAKAYWLIDSIAIYQPQVLKDPMLREIQFWKLNVENESGVLICERDTDDVFLTERIPYTDFPLANIKLYVENKVLYLPSER